MAKQVRKETTSVQQEEVVADMPVVDGEQAEKREVMLDDVDKLLDEIEAVLDADEQRELDEAIERAAYREKLKSIAFLGKRATDPCLEPGLIRVPEALAERLLSAGIAREHDCNDCD